MVGRQRRGSDDVAYKEPASTQFSGSETLFEEDGIVLMKRPDYSFPFFPFFFFLINFLSALCVGQR